MRKTFVQVFLLSTATAASAPDLLIAAASRDERTTVQQLLAEGAVVDAADARGFTSLHAAAARGHAEIVAQLLDAGADAGASGPGLSALHLAVLEGHARVVESILRRGGSPDVRDHQGYTPLHAAAQTGNTAAAAALLHAGADADAAGHDGVRPLHLSAQRGHAAVASALLRAGAAQDAPVDRGTPLAIAARAGHAAVVSALLDGGADLEARNQLGETPLHLAAFLGREPVLRLLLERGACADACSDNDKKALFYVAEGRHARAVEMAEALVTHGADVDGPNGGEVRATAMHEAAWGGHVRLVRTLLQIGARCDLADGAGRTARDLAEANGHTEAAAALHDASNPDGSAAPVHGVCASSPTTHLPVDELLGGAASETASDLEGLSGRWREHAAREQRLTPLCSRVMVGNVDAAAVPPDALLRELAGARQLKYCAFRAAQLALGRERGEVILSEPAALSAEACAKLREAVDAHASTAPEPADGLPLEQLDLSAAQLERLIGQQAAHALWRLPHRFMERSGALRHVAAAEPPGEGEGEGEGEGAPVPPYATFVRRYGADSRPFFKMHADNSVVTCNVALSSNAAHSGGRLIGLFDGSLRFVERQEGEAVLHSSLLLHGVTKMEPGPSRYSLIMFFGRAAAEGQVQRD